MRCRQHGELLRGGYEACVEPSASDFPRWNAIEVYWTLDVPDCRFAVVTGDGAD